MPRQDPAVVRVLREYREALERKELDAMRGLASSWLEIERRLDADIAALCMEMDRRRAAGEIITEQMVWRMDRYKAIKAKLGEEIKRWNTDHFVPDVETLQAQFGLLGIESARDAIFAACEVSAPYFPVLNRDAVETMVGYLGNGAPLNTLLKQDYPDALAGLTRALVNGMARGLGPAQVAREMADGMGMGLERAMLIARTEINRAYRAASIQQYRESRVVSGFRRLVKRETACMACLLLDGQTFDLAEELSDHPRGKCVAIPLVIGGPSPRWQTGKEWFNTLTAAEQRERMGAERYTAWKDGTFRLDALARMSHSDVWGDAPRVATLAELRDGG
jgi:hypothetical protein